MKGERNLSGVSMTSQAPVLPQRAVSTDRDHSSSRGALLRRLFIFQVKLFADGLRDLVDPLRRT